MHCPACNKDFSPVHSRCPDCNGWLRTAKSNSGSTGGAARPSALAAPGGGAPDPPTQRLAAASSAGVTLPSRPTAKPAAPPAPVPQAPVPVLGGPPATAPRAAAAPDDSAFGGRGGLGSGWESSGSFAAPAPAAPTAPPAGAQWGGDGLATGRMQAPATAGWGNGAGQAPPGPGALGAAPAASGWGASAGAPASGWGASGAPAAPSPPAAAGPGMSGLGGGPGASSWGAVSAPSGPASSPGGGGGWLGDGGAVAPSGPVFAPAVPQRSSESWLGGGDAPAGPTSLAPPPAAEMPLELPDHTVAVDLGTPWDEDEASSGGSSNKMIYMVLGCLVLSLTLFSGYIYWQRSKLNQKAPPGPSITKESSSSLGESYLKKASVAYNAKRWEEAQQSAELARDLMVGLKGLSAAKVKQVKAFYAKSTSRQAQNLFDQAKRANAAHETNQAIGLCNQAAEMYSRVPKTQKLQAQAFAYEGRIYESLGDAAAAEGSYRKAHSLSPGAGYGAMANAARRIGAPSAPPPEPGPAEPAPTVEQPQLGDGGLYPQGSGTGGYHPSGPAPAPAAAPAPGSPSRPRPVNNYVPPKRPSAPRHNDQLPTYNH